MGKGENAGNQHFLLFPQCFVPNHTEIIVSAMLKFSSANAFNLDQSKILSFGKELKGIISYVQEPKRDEYFFLNFR